MKLIGDFFEVLESSVGDAGYATTIKLNSSHIVYTGHFPGHPVTPGVIQLQIVHELLEMHMGRKTKLKTMPMCKFLKILNPTDTPLLVVSIEIENRDGRIKVKAQGKNDEDVFFKINAMYE